MRRWVVLGALWAGLAGASEPSSGELPRDAPVLPPTEAPAGPPEEEPLRQAPPATLPADAPLRERPVGEERPLRRSYLVPAFESAAMNIGLFALHNLVTREFFALISWKTVLNHLDGTEGWGFDVDQFVTNQFAHPYHGSVNFTSARSAGVPFWQSGLYVVFSSMSWELFAENEPPAINDQITTTLGGVFLGEVLHRTYRVVIDEAGGRVSPLRRLAGVLISPASSLNEWIFAGSVDPGDIGPIPPMHWVLTPGANLMTRLSDRTETQAPRLLLDQGLQASISGELTYGALGDAQWRYRHPFSYFDASASLTFPGVSMGTLYIRGLLAGAQFGGGDKRLSGLWGLFGLYDFGANNIVRVSSVGLGFGTTVQARLGWQSYLQGTAIVGGLGFAAAGSLGLDSVLVRDYHIGPGAEAILEARLVRRGLGMVRARAKQWWITGAYAEPRGGFESITYLTLDGRIRVAPRLAVGVELPLALRVSDFGPTASQAIGGGAVRLTLSYMSDDYFGTEDPKPRSLHEPAPEASAPNQP